MMVIEINDLVGNAFASYLSETGKHVLSFKKINAFGSKVVDLLNSQNVEAVLELSKERITDFFDEYSEWFTFIESDNLVILHDNITIKQLIQEFSAKISLPVLLAFRDKNCIKVLLQDVEPADASNITLVHNPISFVKRLTDEQIAHFLDELYPKENGFIFEYYYSKNAISETDYLHISVVNNSTGCSRNNYLADYDSNISNPVKWIKYLHSVFGDEYFKAYLAHCANIFDED